MRDLGGFHCLEDLVLQVLRLLPQRGRDEHFREGVPVKPYISKLEILVGRRLNVLTVHAGELIDQDPKRVGLPDLGKVVVLVANVKLLNN